MRSGREMGVWSGKVFEPGFELWSPVAQHMCIPWGRISLKNIYIKKILLTLNMWSVYFFVILSLGGVIKIKCVYFQLFQNEIFFIFNVQQQ